MTVRILRPIETYQYHGTKAWPTTLVRAHCDVCDCAAVYYASSAAWNSPAAKLVRKLIELLAIAILERTCWALDKFDPRTLRGYPPYEVAP